jgi:voltage-gated potassium channel
LRIVASATDRENVKKLRRAGATDVISPAVIGGELVVRSALGREGMQSVADRIIAASEEDETGTTGTSPDLG